MALLGVPWKTDELGSAADLFVMGLFGYFWVAVTVALLLMLCVARQVPGLSAFLGTRVLRYVGKRSYSIYLFHQAILGVAFYALLNTAPNLASSAGWMPWSVATDRSYDRRT